MKVFKRNIFSNIFDVFDFVILISLYVLYHTYFKILHFITRSKKGTPPFSGLFLTLINKLDSERLGSISRINLIELSIRNMVDKKTRTAITMGGMALGIGLIVLLVSIGYGLEQLVISRVTRLDELRQADVVPGLSDDLTLTDKSLSKFREIPGIKEVIPVISAVGRLKYNNSETDMAVYGVTTNYLRESAIKPSSGTIFESNDLTTSITTPQDKSRSVNNRDIDNNHSVTYTFEPNSWYRVRENADPKSKIIGYTRRIDTNQTATEVTGEPYSWQDKTESRWLEADVPIWEKGPCADEPACEDGEYLPILDKSAQVKTKGYLAEISMKITDSSLAQNTANTQAVLGETTSDGSLPIVEIASLSAHLKDKDTLTLPVGGTENKQMVINQAALSVLGLSENEAIGTKLTIAFVILGDNKSSTTTKTESLDTEYTIIGVIPDSTIPQIYVPFIDLRSLGVETYSQVKVVTTNKDQLARIRTSIESSGYGTTSVVDTIGQIDKLFSTIRMFLAVLGVVALAVAALGMFNTLTVSLLERTHEVGLMKAIGMRGSEVRELFMTESMIMGFFGGILGLILGIIAGNIFSLVLSLFTLTKGAGFISISYVPIPFALLIIGVSLLVGIGTGYIPARRATRISALDALRYE